MNYNDLEPDHNIELFAYVSPSTSPKTINYIKMADVERMKTVKFPTRELSGDGGMFNAPYFINKEGKYGGSASFSHYLKAVEIRDYLMKDREFVERATKEKAIWFFPQELKDIFVF